LRRQRVSIVVPGVFDVMNPALGAEIRAMRV
jgi:hypothetical protein